MASILTLKFFNSSDIYFEVWYDIRIDHGLCAAPSYLYRLHLQPGRLKQRHQEHRRAALGPAWGPLGSGSAPLTLPRGRPVEDGGRHLMACEASYHAWVPGAIQKSAQTLGGPSIIPAWATYGDNGYEKGK